jgi:hypothetical protein
MSTCLALLHSANLKWHFEGFGKVEVLNEIWLGILGKREELVKSLCRNNSFPKSFWRNGTNEESFWKHL